MARAVIGGILLILCFGCGAKVDPAGLDASLKEAETALTAARQMEAEKWVPASLAKAERLLTEAQTQLEQGHPEISLDLAIQARLVAQIAAAESGLALARRRLQKAREEKVKSQLSRMAHQVAEAEARRAIAEHQARVAQAEAQAASHDASQAREDARRARQEAQRQVRQAEVDLAIAKASLRFDAATEVEAATHASAFYSEAKRLLDHARSLAASGQWDEALVSAEQAEQQAEKARVSAAAAVEAIRNKVEANKQQAYTEAKVALARSQVSLDAAADLGAEEYVAELFQEARSELQSAQERLARGDYTQARQMADQAHLHATQAAERTRAMIAEERAKEALEEQIAQAKDAIFKAEEDFRLHAEALRESEQAQVEASLAKARRSLEEEGYEAAIAVAGQARAVIAAAVERAARLRQKELAILDEARRIPGAQAFTTERGVVIRFSGNIFDKGSTALTSSVLPSVKQLAQLLNKYSDYTVLIEGHTDNTGDADYNLTLSKQRADTFVAYLVDAGRIRRSRLKSTGLGESQPIASNATEEGRRLNRRVDVILLTREGT